MQVTNDKFAAETQHQVAVVAKKDGTNFEASAITLINNIKNISTNSWW